MAHSAHTRHPPTHNRSERQQFDKKITSPKPITEPNVIAQLEAIFRNIDTSRPFDDWTVDELQTYVLHRFIEPPPNPWATLGMWASIAFGIPLVVLVIGASLVWAFSGFAAKRP